MRNNAASIIGNGVILLLWQLRCHCNPDHDKFSSLSNTTVVAIFPNVCLWQRIVYAQTWQLYIDPENLYWGTFVCQYAGLCCCIVWPLFLFDCFVKIWAICKNFLGKWSTAPPGRKLPVRLWNQWRFSSKLWGDSGPIWHRNYLLYLFFYLNRPKQSYCSGTFLYFVVSIIFISTLYAINWLTCCMHVRRWV